MKRSREVRRADSWTEYFDPDTSAFWYFDTVGNCPRPGCYLPSGTTNIKTVRVRRGNPCDKCLIRRTARLSTPYGQNRLYIDVETYLVYQAYHMGRPGSIFGLDDVRLGSLANSVLQSIRQALSQGLHVSAI